MYLFQKLKKAAAAELDAQKKTLDIKTKALAEYATLRLPKEKDNLVSSEPYDDKIDEMNKKIEMITKRFEESRNEAMEWKKKFLEQEKNRNAMQQLRNRSENKGFVEKKIIFCKKKKKKNN